MDLFLQNIQPDVFSVYNVEELQELHDANTNQEPQVNQNTIRNVSRRVSNEEYQNRINQASRYGFPKLIDDGHGNVHDNDYYSRKRYLTDYHRDKLTEINRLLKIPVKNRINKKQSYGSMVDKMTADKIAQLRN